MKNSLIKGMAIATGVLSLSLFAGCGEKQPQSELFCDDAVARAFHAVAPVDGLISQTAEASGEEYLVTVITASSVAEYRVDANFHVGAAHSIVGEAPVSTAEVTSEEAPRSDLERAYREALSLSGIAEEEVVSFDFDRDTYMGKPALKVEIEDAAAEYSYIFHAEDFSLLASEVELKHTAGQPGGSSYIGEQRAWEVAFGAVGIAESDAKNRSIKLVPDGGKMLYAAGFDFGGFLYLAQIDAVSGKVVKLSKTILDESAVYPEIPQTITEEQAKAIALAFVFPEGAGTHQVNFRKVKLERERGQFVYEVEFIADGSEYEFEISAADGTILDVEISPEREEQTPPAEGSFLSREEAVSRVLAQAGEGAFLVDVEIEARRVNGEKRYFYEIEVKVNGRELEFYVDAVTGEVTSNDSYTGNPADPTPALTEADALQIALETFGLTEDQLSYQRIELEREEGVLCYEVKLRVGKAEYKLTIDAHSGAILEQEIDTEHETERPSGPAASDFITGEQAAEAVEAYFREQGKQARIEEIEWEDEFIGTQKHYFYEVEVVVDGREYECYVDAVTGEVRVKGEFTGGEQLIGEERALEIALDYFGVSKTSARVIKVKLEEEHGRMIYEVEFKVNSLEYSFEIDAETGEVLESDRSYDD